MQASITIHRGPGGVPAAELGTAIVWSTAAPVPWAGMRTLVSQARARFGDALVEGALSPAVRGVLSLALRGLAARLLPEEVVAVAPLRGSFAAELPNSIVRRRPVFRAWEGFLKGLLPGRPLVVVLPEIDRVDLESLGGVRGLLRAAKGHSLRFVVGHDPGVTPQSDLDSLLREAKLAQLAGLEALPGAIVLEHNEASPIQFQAAIDQLDDGIELRAFASLASGGDRALIRAAAHAALDAHGYDIALQLALKAPEEPGDSPAERRGLRMTRAIAAHNLSPFAQQPWLIDLMVEDFSALLRDERDPLARAHFLYRLGMLFGRGRRELPRALEFANDAVALAEGCHADPRAPFFAAWARNGRAYAHARSGHFDEAARDCEAGLAGIANSVAGEVPTIEVRLVQVLLANNRTAVAASAGDGAALARWTETTRGFRDAIAEEDRPGFAWLPVIEDPRNLDAARSHYDTALSGAREAFDTNIEALAAHSLAVVEYKLGNATRARELFGTSLRIWRIVKGLSDDLLTEELNCGVTAFRAGELSAARTHFETLRADEAFAEPSAQGELAAALAMIAGRGGDRSAAEKLIQSAIVLAEEGGDRESLVRTLRSSAEAYLELDSAVAALPLLARARALILDAEREEAELAPEDVLGVLVSSLDAGERDPTIVARAVATVGEAVSDANAWWDLPRLLRHTQRATAEGAALDTELLEAIVGQRRDASSVAA